MDLISLDKYYQILLKPVLTDKDYYECELLRSMLHKSIIDLVATSDKYCIEVSKVILKLYLNINVENQSFHKLLRTCLENMPN